MNSNFYDLIGFGSGSVGQHAAIAAVRVDGKTAIIDMREVLGDTSPRARKSLREAILYLTVEVLRTALPIEDGAGSRADRRANRQRRSDLN